MPRTRLTALSILLGAALLAPLGVRAQSSSSTYIVGEGNESILEKHLLNGVLVGNYNVTQTSADLLSAFTAFGSNNAIDTAAIVFGNNNSQVATNRSRRHCPAPLRRPWCPAGNPKAPWPGPAVRRAPGARKRFARVRFVSPATRTRDQTPPGSNPRHGLRLRRWWP